MACLRADLDDLLTCFRYPTLEARKAVRTTNAIERRFREVRRRTRPMGTFQDRTSMDRILFAVFIHENRQPGPRHPLRPDTQLLTLPPDGAAGSWAGMHAGAYRPPWRRALLDLVGDGTTRTRRGPDAMASPRHRNRERRAGSALQPHTDRTPSRDGLAVLVSPGSSSASRPRLPVQRQGATGRPPGQDFVILRQAGSITHIRP